MLSCAIITTEASEGTRDLHTRMPLILEKEMFKVWLIGEPPELMESADDVLRFYPVSPRMNKPAHNEPDCVEPLAA